jgi:hypothetical protein
MQQVYGLITFGRSQTFIKTERAKTLMAYAFAFALGLSLVFYIFPLDFLLGVVDKLGLGSCSSPG